MVHSGFMKFLSAIVLVLVLCDLCQHSMALQRLCGRNLPEALDLICVKGYNSKIKRSMDLGLGMELDDYNEIEDELPTRYANSPFLARFQGGSLLAKTRRTRHGIYDECCRKDCTYPELLSYCAK